MFFKTTFYPQPLLLRARRQWPSEPARAEAHFGERRLEGAQPISLVEETGNVRDPTLLLERGLAIPVRDGLRKALQHRGGDVGQSRDDAVRPEPQGRGG
jgi:hypothetical protein